MTIIDGHGAAHDSGTGRYVGRSYRDSDSGLEGPHPQARAIESLIQERYPTAAAVYFADQLPDAGTHDNRIDLIIDADGKILWDYAVQRRVEALLTTDDQLTYKVWLATAELIDKGALDEALPVTDEQLVRDYPTNRRPRVLPLTPKPPIRPLPVQETEWMSRVFSPHPDRIEELPRDESGRVAIDKVDPDKDYFEHVWFTTAFERKPGWLHRLFRRG
jgi:hypothetical protein